MSVDDAFHLHCDQRAFDAANATAQVQLTRFKPFRDACFVCGSLVWRVPTDELHPIDDAFVCGSGVAVSVDQLVGVRLDVLPGCEESTIATFATSGEQAQIAEGCLQLNVTLNVDEGALNQTVKTVVLDRVGGKRKVSH